MRTSWALPGPAIRSTAEIDSPYITMCMSIPGCAQKNRPVRSVIVATVGQRTAPCAAQSRQHDRHGGVGRHDDVGVVLGDGLRASGREPSRHSSRRVSPRIGATCSSSQ